MPVNRFLRPQQLQYQSQFVQEKIPWDLLQAKAEKKQNERDTFLNSAYKLGEITPAGIDTTVDHFGQPIDLGDYSESVQEVEGLQNELNNFAKDFSNTELNRDSYSKYAELQKRYNQVKLKNDLRAKRAEGLKAITDQRVKDKVNNYDPRGVWYQEEINKMSSDKNYIPSVQGHQDVFNETAFVNEATKGINSELQALGAHSTGLYISEYKKTGRTPEKVKSVFDGAFYGNSELQQAILNEAKQVAIQNGMDINTVMSYKDQWGNDFKGTVLEATQKHKYDEMLSQALGAVSSEGTQSLKSDATGIYKDKLKQDKLLTMPLTGQAVTNLEGKSFIEKQQELLEWKQNAQQATTEIPKLTTQLKSIATYDSEHNMWVANSNANPQQVNELVDKIEQYNQAKTNYNKSYSQAEKDVTSELKTTAKKELLDNYDSQMQSLISGLPPSIAEKLQSKVLDIKNQFKNFKVNSFNDVEALRQNLQQVLEQDYIHNRLGEAPSLESNSYNQASRKINENMLSQDAQLTYETASYAGNDKNAMQNVLQSYITTNAKGLKAYDTEGNDFDLGSINSVEITKYGHTLNTKRSPSGKNSFTVTVPVTKEDFLKGKVIENVEVEFSPNSDIGKMVLSNSLSDLNYMEQYNGGLSTSQNNLRNDLAYMYASMDTGGKATAEEDAAKLGVGNSGSTVIQKDNQKYLLSYKRTAQDNYYVTTQIITNEPSSNNKNAYNLKYIKDDAGNTLGVGNFRNLANYFGGSVTKY